MQAKFLSKPFPRLSVRVRRAFTLAELLIVLIIVAVLSALGFRAVQPILISGRVESTAAELNVAIQKIVASGAVSGLATPFSDVGAAEGNLDNALRTAVAGSTILPLAGTVVNHRLNASGIPAPTVLIASSIATRSGTAAGTADGTAFSLTLNGVHSAACPDIVTQLAANAFFVTVQNGEGAVVPVLSRNVTVIDYNAIAVLCGAGDVNTVVANYRR
ncbi:MAG: prepilin-type N-terminal cleavage/methylation domain-containing protein [Gammaproteobacteria bacterium]|nr:prepilin-type N-terminal cleavage/methylation domain-containing protein [Gammaproteobacteria bacterium]